MDRKINDVIQSVGGYEKFDQLVKRGRHMHDQAVFDLFTRSLSRIARFVTGHFSIKIKRQKSNDAYQEFCEPVF
jgi:hypothetical protein